MSTINLLPEDYIRRRGERRANVLCLALFGVVMLGVGAAWVISTRSWRRTLTVKEQVNASYAEAGKMIGQLQELEARRSKLVTKAEQTASLMERVPRSYLLAVITNSLPKDASLEELELELVDDQRVRIAARQAARGKTSEKFAAMMARQATQVSPKVVSMKVTGRAATDVGVARFIANLARDPLTRSVDLVFSEEREIDDDVIRHFQVRVELVPGADVLVARRLQQRPVRAQAGPLRELINKIAGAES